MENLDVGEIRVWINQAQQRGARWLLIGHDAFDFGHYPIAIRAEEDPWQRVQEVTRCGNKVHEAYDLTGNIEAQLRSQRTWSLPPRYH